MAEKKQSFEQMLQALEGVVEKLESGKLSLDESLSLYEEGIKLARGCNRALDGFERRVELLRRGEDGVVLEPFDKESESE